MLQRLIVVFLFALVCHSSFASCPAPPADSSTYKLGEQEFLERYGNDINTERYIRYIFRHRRVAKTMLFIGIPAGLLAGSLLLVHHAELAAAGYGFFGILLLGICLMAAAVVSLIGALMFVHYSRRRLLRKLQDPEKLPRIKDDIPEKEPRPKPFTRKARPVH